MGCELRLSCYSLKMDTIIKFFIEGCIICNNEVAKFEIIITEEIIKKDNKFRQIILGVLIFSSGPRSSNFKPVWERFGES